jgi:hypothetical protein
LFAPSLSGARGTSTLFQPHHAGPAQKIFRLYIETDVLAALSGSIDARACRIGF